ncbi:MAG: hypothetical protein ACYCY2_15750, partial [Acidithiobacillus ferriphilus]
FVNRWPYRLSGGALAPPLKDLTVYATTGDCLPYWQLKTLSRMLTYQEVLYVAEQNPGGF